MEISEITVASNLTSKGSKSQSDAEKVEQLKSNQQELSSRELEITQIQFCS